MNMKRREQLLAQPMKKQGTLFSFKSTPIALEIEVPSNVPELFETIEPNITFG